jgi:hemerythrin
MFIFFNLHSQFLNKTKRAITEKEIKSMNCIDFLGFPTQTTLLAHIVHSDNKTIQSGESPVNKLAYQL